MERIVKRENLEGSYVVEVWLLKMWAEGNKRGAYDDSQEEEVAGKDYKFNL